uniref:Uncharacterized protein n=1 Tax=viral metagenome TaxID=1070528 RepID=A0A6H1ZV46_9ZZZZ
MKQINYNILPDYMRNEAKRYIEEGIPCGDFLTAVFENNLVEAFGKADDTNQMFMFEYAKFLYNEAPRSCWGSKETVDKWISNGGLKGVSA